MRRISLLTFLVGLKFVPQVEPAPVSNWSPSPRSTDSSPVTVGMKRSRENGQEAEPDVEPAPKKAFGFEMKLSSNMVKIFMQSQFSASFNLACLSLFPSALSKRDLVNMSFNLQVNAISFSYEKMSTKTRCGKEAKGNSEMAS